MKKPTSKNEKKEVARALAMLRGPISKSTKTQKAELARALASLRKTYGGPEPKCHPDKPDPDCPRCRKRLAQRKWRLKAAREAAGQP